MQSVRSCLFDRMSFRTITYRVLSIRVSFVYQAHPTSANLILYSELAFKAPVTVGSLLQLTSAVTFSPIENYSERR